MNADKAKAVALLAAWIDQKPGLERGNYGSQRDFDEEASGIEKDRRQARTLLRAVELIDLISAPDIRAASDSAFSGRLTLTEDRIDYCTGQYWPTEYRRAACAVLASTLWAYWRPFVPADVENKGQYLRDRARREFGPAIQKRWFN